MTGQQHNIVITRGESFSVDKRIVNEDGSPYIVSNAMKNPHLLLTISSSKYNQKGRQIFRVWFPIKATFYSTNAIKLNSFGESPSYQIDIPEGVNQEDYAVYYTERDGVKTYKRYIHSSYVDYDLRLIYTFTSLFTNNLIEQDYEYSIDLVDGDAMNDKIRDLYVEYCKGSVTKIEDMYNELKNLDLANDLDLDKPLANITFSMPILTPKALIINNNVSGGYYE